MKRIEVPQNSIAQNSIAHETLRQQAIATCVDFIHRGASVAFPTETVYGLGGDATNSHAVRTIFQVKNRPTTNPLIIHVATLEQAKDYAFFPPPALQLARLLWPGALTLVLERKQKTNLAPEIYGKLPTVAVRIPSHPFAQQLLRACQRPLAAPSANVSGKLSPTSGAHVFASFKEAVFKPDLVVDAGACMLGLESTIVDFKDGVARILRHGSIPSERIEACLRHNVLYATKIKKGQTPLSPGQLFKHYAPSSPLFLQCDPYYYREGQHWLFFGPEAPAPHDNCLNLSSEGNVEEACFHLFDMLHLLDQKAAGRPIFVMPIAPKGLGKSINDRLEKAAFIL